MKTVRILVVDDEKSVRGVVVELLDNILSACAIPHRIIQAERGRNAVDIITGYGAHIVITDIGLPDISGVKVIEAACDNSVVIAMSGHATAKETKADFFLQKPFSVRNFSITLINALSTLFTPES